MRILFTGASSFTGYWFVKALADGGHDVVATFRGPLDGYSDLRGERVARVRELCQCEPDVAFGDEAFLDLITTGDRWDVMCHHGADVTNYKSPDFDYGRALTNNTRNARSVLAALRERGCETIALTGSVFENDEGAGSEGLPAFSSYGLSKALTHQAFRLHAREADVRLGKFVIPNPFGPFEEPRFTAYLIRCWQSGKTARVNTPAYVRDNIHVSLLAAAYARFVEGLPRAAATSALRPSGYVESQGAFAERFARELRSRLGLDCALEPADQTEFTEPRTRINTDPVDGHDLGWSEAAAWDEIAEYYRGKGLA